MWCGGAALGQQLEDEVRYEARDSIRYDLANQTVYLFGAATVNYQDIQLSADRIAFSFKNEIAEAFGAPDSAGTVVGKPSFTQGGHTIDADSIRYSFRSKEGLIREVRTQEQEAWVHASLSKRHANGEVHSKGGMLTTCDRPHPHYHFKVGRMMVIPDDKIVAGPAYMKIGKVPTPLAVPFGLFPNKKGGSSGLLIPVWGNNQNLGYFLLNGGWYMPFGQHVDQQLTGDIYSRGSWALKSVTRYKARYRYSGNLELNHSTLLTSDPEFPDFSRQRNFFINWRHVVDAKASLTDRFSASLNVGTSSNFTNNFNSSTNQYLSNTFQSNIGWTHLWPGKPYTLSVNALHRQNTIERSFSVTLPAVTFNLQRILPIQLLRPAAAAPRWYDQLAFNYTANFDNRLTTTEEHLYLENIGPLARQARNGIKHSAALTTTFKNRFFSLNPEFRVTDRMYFEQLRKTVFAEPDTTYTVTDTVPKFGAPLEWSTGAALTSKLYGTYFFFGEGLKAIRHTITPTVGFTYRPDNSTRIEGPFGTDGAIGSYSPYQIGIYGEPSAGESGSLNFGLIQNVEAKVRDRKAMADSTSSFNAAQEGEVTYKKIKLIDYLSLNASRDLLKDSLQWSNVGISTRTSLFNVVNINLNSSWDPYAVDSLGRRIDRSERSVSGALARMVYTNVAIGFDVKSKRYGQPVASSTNDRTVVNDSDPTKGAEVNFSMPWRLGVNYSYDVSRAYSAGTFTDTERQSVLFNGDVTVLKYWKLGVSSGYDLVAEDWTPTSLNLYWDLHCWEFNFNIIPLGERKSFMFRINVKASILRDLKYEQRKPYGNDRDLLY
ncbi:MAG: LPS-assembly protein LptD [Flavobacteriales bacterium]|nr:LPS-assembly protein LptD [Flavobacteriales bacterium]